MKTRAVIVSLALLLAGAGLCQAADAGPWSGNLNLRAGFKLLDDSDWDPVDTQGEVALQLDFRKPDWPISVALDVSYSSDDDSESVFVTGFGQENADVEGRTLEWNIGVRKIWEGSSLVRPYAGGGLALIWAKQKWDATIAVEEEDDTGIGAWIGGGAFVTLWEHWNFGVDVRYSYAKVELIEDTNGGGLHAGMLAGYHW